MNFLRLLAINIFLCINVSAQPVSKDSVRQHLTMARTYIMVLLEEGENKPTDQQAYEELVFNHLGLLYQLQAEGKILVQGQILTDTRLAAMMLFNTHTEYEVKQLIEKSELIQKGYMTYRTFRWFGEPGQFSILNKR